MDDNNNNNNQQQSYTPPPAYNPNQPYQQNFSGQQLEPPLSLGNWIIIMILVAIPCVNIIMLFIWAFGRNVNTSKKNYSRAMLIFMAISIVLGLIFGSVVASMLSSFTNMYY
jgi:ABC-type multidrug transport system permease subunit